MVPIWYLWAVITLVTLWIAHRFPLELRRWPLYVAAHAGIGAAVAAGAIALIALYNRHFIFEVVDESYLASYARFAAHTFHYYFLFYAAIHGMYYAFDFYRKYRERELKATRLEAQLVTAQLEALKMQLHPHFLFNTLNAISALMDEDVTTARSMLIHLSRLLRLTLDRVDKQEVTLQQELAFIDCYLEIEKVRHGESLDITMDVDRDVLQAQVPTLILQPIVENAVRHGSAPCGQISRLAIQAFRKNGQIVLQVVDNGPGLRRHAAAATSRRGIGLANTRARLQQRYGEAHSFSLKTRDQNGLKVRLAFPYYTRSDTLEVVG